MGDRHAMMPSRMVAVYTEDDDNSSVVRSVARHRTLLMSAGDRIAEFVTNADDRALYNAEREFLTDALARLNAAAESCENGYAHLQWNQTGPNVRPPTAGNQAWNTWADGQKEAEDVAREARRVACGKLAEEDPAPPAAPAAGGQAGAQVVEAKTHLELKPSTRLTLKTPPDDFERWWRSYSSYAEAANTTAMSMKVQRESLQRFMEHDLIVRLEGEVPYITPVFHVGDINDQNTPVSCERALRDILKQEHPRHARRAALFTCSQQEGEDPLMYVYRMQRMGGRPAYWAGSAGTDSAPS